MSANDEDLELLCLFCKLDPVIAGIYNVKNMKRGGNQNENSKHG